MDGANGWERFETVIIGGGQAGLSVGYHLMKRDRPFLILDANERIGDAWRKRWDSLRVFTPARYDGLPGTPFPAPHRSFPTKEEVADYLEAYAGRFDLPVRTGVRVDRLTKEGNQYVVTAGDRRFEADNVVVASGVRRRPERWSDGCSTRRSARSTWWPCTSAIALGFTAPWPTRAR